MLKKILRAESSTNKIRLPKSIIDTHGRVWVMEYNGKYITLKPLKEGV